VTDGHF